MDNVLQFRPRKAAEPAPVAAQPSQVGNDAAVGEMLVQSAAMQVISTLAFYANQGFDHGRRARAAVGAMNQILAAASGPSEPLAG